MDKLTLILSGQQFLLHLKAVLYLQHFSSHGLHSYLLCLEWSGHGDGGHVLRPEKSCQSPNIFVIQILRFPRDFLEVMPMLPFHHVMKCVFFCHCCWLIQAVVDTSRCAAVTPTTGQQSGTNAVIQIEEFFSHIRLEFLFSISSRNS